MVVTRKPPGQIGKTHLHGSDPKRALDLARAVSGLRSAAVVAVGEPCRRPERVRALCLARLAVELAPRITGFVVESRGRGPNRADRKVLDGLSSQLGRQLGRRFALGADEPILWAADTVASAVFRGLARDATELIGDVEVFHVDGV